MTRISSVRPLRIVFVAGAALVASGCTALLPREAPDPAPLRGEPVGEPPAIGHYRPVLDDPQARWTYHVLVAEMAAARHYPAEAATALIDALQLRPDADMAARATAYAIAADDMPLATRAAEAWRQADQTAAAPREVLMRLYLREGRREPALQLAREMADAELGARDERLRVLALSLAEEAEHGDAALWIFQQVVADTPDDAAAHYALGLLALRQEHLAVAEQAARQALELAPERGEYGLLLASVLIHADRSDDAAVALAPALARSSDPAALRVGFAQLLIEAGHSDAARAQMQQALEVDPDNVEARQALGLLALDAGDFDTARHYFDALYNRGQSRGDAAYYLGRIHELAGDDLTAQGWYARALDGSRGIDATARLANTEARLGDIGGARERLRQLRRRYPGAAQLVYGLEGQMLYGVGSFRAARDVFATALGLYPDDADLRYGHALTLEQLGRMIEAESELRRLLTRDPDDVRALNALGYLLTVNTTRYDEARSLIERALALEPEDPAILDSMGWVLFKQGDLALAHDYLQSAYQALPDPEIAAHYGELLWALGRHDAARDIWRAALTDAPVHPVLRETVQRLDR